MSWSLSSKVMLPYDKLQRGFANNQTTRNSQDLAGVLRLKEGAKILPAKTKLDGACQLRRQVLKQSD